MKLIVKRREHEFYITSSDDTEKVIGTGHTINGALANYLRTHQVELGLEITFHTTSLMAELKAQTRRLNDPKKRE